MSKTNRVLLTVPAAILTALLVAAGCAAPGKEVAMGGTPAGQQSSKLLVKDIRSSDKDSRTVITVEGSQPLAYSMFKLDGPSRLAVDLPGADLGQFAKNIPVNRGSVSFIKPMPAEQGKDKPNVSRLEIFLTKPVEYEIKAEGNALNVVLTEKANGSAPEAPASAPVTVASASPTLLPVQEKPAPRLSAKAEPKTEATAEIKPEPRPAKVAEIKVAQASAPAKAAPEAPRKPATKAIALDVLSNPQGTQVIVEGDGNLEYEYFLVESKSVVVDIFGVANGIQPMTRKVADEYIKQVRVGEHFEPRKKVRVVMDLAKPSDYKLIAAGSKILVNFGALAKESEDKLRASLSNLVTDVYFRPMDDRSIIEVVSTQPPVYQKVDSEDPNRLILEVDNSRVSAEAQKTLDLVSLNREISKIVSFQYKKNDTPTVRIVAQFKEKVPYRVNVEGNKLLVDIPRAKAAAVAAAPAGNSGNSGPAPAAQPGTAAGVAGEAAPARQFTGRKLSLDFKDADIADVLRLIADVSGMNFVSGSEVKGKVTIKLSDVPWDQALDVILKSNTPPLTQIPEADNIIRITTLENVRREEEEKQRRETDKVKAVETQIKLEPLVTRSIHISYAKVKDLASRAQNFMSTRATNAPKDAFLQFDERTNTLIVRDLAANVEEIEKMVQQLDTPTPAVQIEARIVSVNSNYAKDLGIQWGFNFAADQAHGNPTTFAFPNSVNLGGTVTENNFLVNLPASSPTAGIGLALGHIANTMSLDLRLTAMETMGQVEILSNPKVFVVQNEKALINIGQQLPVPKTDAEGNRTVEFKDVGIKLEVTPQVTADNRVFMDVQVERSRRGENVETTEGTQFSIDTERAQTKVLLNNGETSVIGGLFQQTKTNSRSGVPGLSNLPFIGWLFKQKNNVDSRQELLIFLTPKIVQPI